VKKLKKIVSWQFIAALIGMGGLAYLLGGQSGGYVECRVHREDPPPIPTDIAADLFDPVCRTAAAAYLDRNPSQEPIVMASFIREAHAKLPNLRHRTQ
jgi:hypothetical protein